MGEERRTQTESSGYKEEREIAREYNQKSAQEEKTKTKEPAVITPKQTGPSSQQTEEERWSEHTQRVEESARQYAAEELSNSAQDVERDRARRAESRNARVQVEQATADALRAAVYDTYQNAEATAAEQQDLLADYSTKIHVYINENLVSGSGDKMRDLVQAYWKPTPADDRLYYMGPAMRGTYSNYTDLNIERSKISNIWNMPHEDQSTVSNNLLFPSTQTSIYLIGDPDAISDDNEWKTIIKGGKFYPDMDYPGVMSPAAFDDQVFTCNLPYEFLEAKTIGIAENIDSPVCKITYAYNTYIPEYENKDVSALELPNVYFIMGIMAPSWSWSDSLLKFATLNNVYVKSNPDTDQKIITSIIEAREFDWPPEAEVRGYSSDETQYRDYKFNMNEYYKTFSNTVFDSNDTDVALRQLSNIIVDSQFSDGDDADLFEWPLPSYVKINSHMGTVNSFGQIIIDNKFENILLSSIKKYFVDSNDFNVQSKTMRRSNSALEKNPIGEGWVEAESLTSNNLRYVDFNQILLDEVYNNLGDNDNIVCLSTDAIESRLINDTVGTYRFYRTIRATKVLEQMSAEMWNMSSEAFTFPRANVDSALPDWVLSEFLDRAENNKLTTTVGYRIEKVAITASENGPSQETVIQNYYVANMPNKNEFAIYDTQVKYGATYTYNIYEYKLVVGYRYKYSDFKPSRLIGEMADPDPVYGLEFYNIHTDQAESPYTWPPDTEPLDASYYENALATGAQVSSENKYMCECRLSIETTAELYEVPVVSKPMTITDNPPRKPDIFPYQIKNNSQEIGFFVRKDSFVSLPYPVSLDANEEEFQQNYLTSNNLVPEENISNASKTKLRHVQIYRIEQKPQSIKDFDGALVTEKDLSLTEMPPVNVEGINDFISSPQMAAACFYTEKVKTNKKYYYTFRFLNEHRQAGRFSPVYVAELIDDGGYKYANFDIMLKSELNITSPYNNPSISFKKLLHLVPNLNQVYLDTSALDYEKTAYENLSNITVGAAADLIWGKAFKIRLTSRKTGKKIDLNVTYNLREIV